jgi:hypothetical protein
MPMSIPRKRQTQYSAKSKHPVVRTLIQQMKPLDPGDCGPDDMAPVRDELHDLA